MSKRVPIVAAGAVAILAAAAVAVVFRSGDGAEPRTAIARGEHNGMVRGTVWVANEDGASLTAIDAGRNEVLTTLTGIEGPHNLQASPDGRSVWAVSGHESEAVMVDAADFSLHGAVATGKEPAHVVVAPDGRTVYTTNGAGPDLALDLVESRVDSKGVTIQVFRAGRAPAVRNGLKSLTGLPTVTTPQEHRARRAASIGRKARRAWSLGLSAGRLSSSLGCSACTSDHTVPIRAGRLV